MFLVGYNPLSTQPLADQSAQVGFHFTRERCHWSHLCVEAPVGCDILACLHFKRPHASHPLAQSRNPLQHTQRVASPFFPLHSTQFHLSIQRYHLHPLLSRATSLTLWPLRESDQGKSALPAVPHEEDSTREVTCPVACPGLLHFASLSLRDQALEEL